MFCNGLHLSTSNNENDDDDEETVIVSGTGWTLPQTYNHTCTSLLRHITTPVPHYSDDIPASLPIASLRKKNLKSAFH